MPPPYAGVARLRIMGRNHAGQTVNVLHFGTNLVGYDAANPTAPLTDLVNEMLTGIRAAMLPAVCDDWKLDKVTAQQIFPNIGDELEVAGIGTDVGDLAATDVSFVAQLISVKTGKGGRTKRGRMFNPPPPEAGVTNSELTGAQFLLLTDWANDLASRFVVGGANLGDWRMVVLSRKTAALPGNDINDGVTEVQTLSPVRDVASMRSRKKGKGS